MKLSYSVTGAERKSLVAAISQELNAPAKYLGMPSAAYEVGGYTVDKTGTVTGPDNRELAANLRGPHGFTAVTEEYDAPLHEAGETPAFEDLRMTEREELGLGQERRDPAGEDGMQASDVPESYTYKAELSDPDCPDRMEVFSADNDEDAIRQAYEFCENEVLLLELHELDKDYNVIRSVEITPRADRLTIEVPLDGFTPEKLDNLTKLVNAKAPLLKAALGTDKLPIRQTADTLQFPWFRGEGAIDADHADAYAALVSLLCKTARDKKRVTAKEKDIPDNPKYAMRCWLLSLGFIGDEYKTARKILLSRLEGNSSFKSGERRQPVDAPVQEDADPAEPDDLAEALADAELIHQVNASFDAEGGNE